MDWLEDMLFAPVAVAAVWVEGKLGIVHRHCLKGNQEKSLSLRTLVHPVDCRVGRQGWMLFLRCHKNFHIANRCYFRSLQENMQLYMERQKVRLAVLELGHCFQNKDKLNKVVWLNC